MNKKLFFLQDKLLLKNCKEKNECEIIIYQSYYNRKIYNIHKSMYIQYKNLLSIVFLY